MAIIALFAMLFSTMPSMAATRLCVLRHDPFVLQTTDVPACT